MAIVAPADRPKSVRYRYVIERFLVSLCNFTFALSVVLGCLSYGFVRSIPYSL